MKVSNSPSSNLTLSSCPRMNGISNAALLTIGLLIAALVSAGTSHAVEESELFLNELRARGYFDTASDYLEYIAKSDLADDEFKRSVPYEQARTLVSQAGTVGDVRERDKMLLTAVEKFKTFAKNEPAHPQVTLVRMQISNVYMALANAKLKEADRPDADKTALREEARKLMKDAGTDATEAEKAIQAERKGLEGKDKKLNKEQTERRDFLRIEWMKSELLQATITYELSKTYEPGSDEHKKQLDTAATGFEELFEKHRRRMPGLYARLQQGRCLLDKKDKKAYESALECLVDLLDQDDKIPQLRALKMEALRYSMESWIGLKKYDDAIKMAGITFRPGEQDTDKGMAVRFFLAKAYNAKGASLEGKDKELMLKKASEIAKDLAKTRSEWTTPARELLDTLGVVVVEENKDPTTFDEAFEQALAALQRRSMVQKNLDKATADKKPELQKQLDAESEKAFKLCRLAISLADNDTPDVRLSTVQKALCYLFWERGDHLHAAVVGTYLARQYPDSEAGKFGSWLAMNAWITEYGMAGDDTAHETRQIIGLANNIVKRWPDSTEAIESRFRLINFAIQAGKIDVAMEHLNAIPTDSPRRGKAELTVGQSLWRKYARDRRLPQAERPPQEKMDELLEQARTVLTDGLTRMKDTGTVDANLVGAAYSLAQLYAGINKPVEAINLFEDEKYGPLTLVQAGDPIAEEGNYKLKTYRLALRSYVSALPDSPGKEDELLEKAMRMVEKLEAEVGDSGESAEQLTRIYIEMGTELEDQLKELVERGDEAGRQALSIAFEKFLDKIRNRETGTTYSSLIWIAETFYGLAMSNMTEPGKANATAANYFERAADTYQRILDKAAAEPGYLKNPRQRTTIEMRMAKCYRNMGQYDKALDRLVEILKRKAANLTVQVEAAETLFDAGVDDCDNYTKSILGAVPDEKDKEKKIIWGWRKLARATQQEEKFRSYFFLAKLYSVKSRLGLAICVAEKEPESRAKLLDAAKTTLLDFHRQYPQLGGEDSRAEFERTLKKIQEEMGEEVTGLPEIAIEAPVDDPEEETEST